MKATVSELSLWARLTSLVGLGRTETIRCVMNTVSEIVDNEIRNLDTHGQEPERINIKLDARQMEELARLASGLDDVERPEDLI